MKYIVIGCGRVGSGLAHLLNLKGHDVAAVDRDPLAFERLGPGFRGKKVVGIGFDRDVLLEAGIERADGLAAVTASDEANVVVARAASQIFRVPRVSARLYDPRKAEIYQRLGVQTVAPIPWGIHRLAELLSYSPFDPVLSLGGGGVEIVEVPVPPRLAGRVVRDLTVLGEIQVVAISRTTTTFIPTLGAIFRAGDIAHVAVAEGSADRLNQLLGVG
ncbi:MAG: potassium channel family protein [Anaerolineae bacterium]